MRAARGAAAPVVQVPIERAAMHGWSLQAGYSPPPPWTPGPGPAGPGGFPAAFDIKSGAPAGQARSPGGIPEIERRVKDAAPYNSGRTGNIPTPGMQNGRPFRTARSCV